MMIHLGDYNCFVCTLLPPCNPDRCGKLYNCKLPIESSHGLNRVTAKPYVNQSAESVNLKEKLLSNLRQALLTYSHPTLVDELA